MSNDSLTTELSQQYQPAGAINEQLLEALKFAYVLLKDQCMDTALVKLKIETAIASAEAEKAKECVNRGRK